MYNVYDLNMLLDVPSMPVTDWSLMMAGVHYHSYATSRQMDYIDSSLYGNHPFRDN